jgi:hypothetical protein
MSDLFPANVALLQSLGIEHQWRPADHEIIVKCPVCAGSLVIDESKKYHICFGVERPPGCPTRQMDFEELMEKFKLAAAKK